MDACSESTRAVTYGGDSVLHLAVNSNCFEAAKFLVDKMVAGSVDDYELINLKDEKGNTALHLAVARKQFQTVKLLLSKQGIIDVNATNKKGFTPLDVLLESPSQHGDLVFGEAIRVAGGKTAAELETPPPPFHASHQDGLGIPHAERKPNKDGRRRGDKDYQNTPGTLMVVATLIAAITFQAGLSPPGGFSPANGTISQRDQVVPPSGDKEEDTINAGMAVLDLRLILFLAFDMVGLFASLSIILLLICVVPRRKRMLMGVLVWVMWVAVFCTALAFQCAALLIYGTVMTTVIVYLASAWIGLLLIAIISVSIRFIIRLLRWVRWLKRRGGDGEERIERGTPLLLKRILVVVSVAALVATVAAVAACVF